MTPERGPLPPHDYRGGEGFYEYADRRAIEYAAAEVARLAGQAVAWQVRSNLRDDMPSDQWSAWESVSHDEYDFQKSRGLSFIEVRALGVIATPSADGAELCQRYYDWLAEPKRSKTLYGAWVAAVYETLGIRKKS